MNFYPNYWSGVMMNSKVVRGIATISASLLAIMLINIIFYLLKVDDPALTMTFVALASAATSIDIHIRLSEKYLTRETLE